MKPIERMTEEEILDEAVTCIGGYLANLGRCGEFSEEDCLNRCIGWVKGLYKRSVGLPSGPSSRQPMTASQVDELTRLCVRLDRPLRERIARAQEKYQKEKAIYQINSTTAQALVRTALKEVGLDAKVLGQKYRARVELTLPKDARLRFYLRYKDLGKAGAVEGIVNVIASLRDELVCPGATLQRHGG